MSQDFKEDCKINKYDLDGEWERQPINFQQWTESLADAINEKEKLKSRMDFLSATIAKKVRSNPRAYGLEKVTDKAIESIITLDPDFSSLSDQFIDANYNMNVLKGAVGALEQKRESLAWLSRLFLKSYYGAVQEKDFEFPEIKEQMDDVVQELHSRGMEKNERLIKLRERRGKDGNSN